MYSFKTNNSRIRRNVTRKVVNSRRMWMQQRQCLSEILSIGKDLSHRHPDVFHMHSVSEKLLSLPLVAVLPVAFHPIIHPGPFHVLRCRRLDKFWPDPRTEIPHCLNVMVLCQVFCEMVPVTCNDVDDTRRYVWCVEHLEAWNAGFKLLTLDARISISDDVDVGY